MGEDIIKKIESGSHVLVPKHERYLRYVSLVSVIALIFTIGISWGKADDRMFDSAEQKTTIINSIETLDVMSLDEMQDEFVTRREYELLLQGQSEIKDMIREHTKGH